VEMTDPMPAVLGVLAVMAAALWWLRKKGALRFFCPQVRPRVRRLESMERLPLSPHHTLYLVRLDERTLLVAESPSGLALLDGGGTASLRAAAEHA